MSYEERALESVVGGQVEVVRVADEDGVAGEGGDVRFLLLPVEGDGDPVAEVLGELRLVDGDR